jgi:hypothetical protein
VRRRALGLGTQVTGGARRVLGTVDGRPGDEHVRAGVSAPLDRLVRHAPVDLDPDLPAVQAAAFRCPTGAPGAKQGPGAADLRQHHVEELLAAEAGLHRHQQHHVDLVKQVFVLLDGRARVDAEAGARPGGPDGPERPDRGLRGFGVDGDAPRPGFRVGGGIPVGVLDHQMAVDRQHGMLEQRLDDRQAEGEVRDEVVVHDVDVKPVGGFLDGLRFVGEPCEVGGQDAGRDLNGHDSSLPGDDPP